jgi:hypothetical protein
MRPNDILRLLQRQPFRPFRLYILENTVFEIRHPEMAMVGRSTLALSIPTDSDSEHEIVIALMHITRMEPITASQSPPLAAG